MFHPTTPKKILLQNKEFSPSRGAICDGSKLLANKDLKIPLSTIASMAFQLWEIMIIWRGHRSPFAGVNYILLF